jgi:hypothetical protein
VSERTFDPAEWPAYLINGAESYTQRKWAESQARRRRQRTHRLPRGCAHSAFEGFSLTCARTQLAEIGYKTYTRINAIWLDSDDCVNSTGSGCQQGLTIAHLHAWKRIAASVDERARGFLVLEEDVTFHEHFRTLFPRYMAQVRVRCSGGPATLHACHAWLEPSGRALGSCGLQRRLRGPAQPRCALFGACTHTHVPRGVTLCGARVLCPQSYSTTTLPPSR